MLLVSWIGLDWTHAEFELVARFLRAERISKCVGGSWWQVLEDGIHWVRHFFVVLASAHCCEAVLSSPGLVNVPFGCLN